MDAEFIKQALSYKCVVVWNLEGPSNYTIYLV
jgi:hypothetical protein